MVQEVQQQRGTRVAPAAAVFVIIEIDVDDEERVMRNPLKLVTIGVLGVTLIACTAEVEDPGEAPDVDVSGGRTPDIDVEPADVQISTDTQVVEVPDVDVNP